MSASAMRQGNQVLLFRTTATNIVTATAVEAVNPPDQYVVAKNLSGGDVVVSGASGTNREGA